MPEGMDAAPSATAAAVRHGMLSDAHVLFKWHVNCAGVSGVQDSPPPCSRLTAAWGCPEYVQRAVGRGPPRKMYVKGTEVWAD